MEITYQKTYREYKAELDGELQKTAEGFVRIGYLLKVARDTNVLAESGYSTVTEFAEAEYNLNKTQVSRFISINDKFSEGGYSDRLQEEYRGFGYAKLTIMLQLPDAVNEELNPSYSKAEIQAIKDEVDKEREVSDIEIAIEAAEEAAKPEGTPQPESTRTVRLYETILQLGEDEPELFAAVAQHGLGGAPLQELMAPNGDGMYSVRVRGIGRLMITFTEGSDTVKLIDIRRGGKESYTWGDMEAAWSYAGAFGDGTPQELWERKYGRKFPVAPVQQAPEQKKTEKKETKKKDSKVKKAPKEWASAYKVGQKVEVYENGHIGELVEKTKEVGRWKVQFATYAAELVEERFTEYTEPENPEPGNSEPQLHDHFEDIPEVADAEEKAEVPGQEEGKEPEAAVELPGQMDAEDSTSQAQQEPWDGMPAPSDNAGTADSPAETVETDITETAHPQTEETSDSAAETGTEEAIEGAQPEAAEGAAVELDETQKSLLERVGKIAQNIKDREWTRALLKIAMLKSEVETARKKEEEERRNRA